MIVHSSLLRREFTSNAGQRKKRKTPPFQIPAWARNSRARALVSGMSRNRDSRNARALPETRIAIDSIVDVQDELRGSARNAVAMRNVVEGPLQLGVLFDVCANVVKALARGLEALFELGLRLDLRLSERHLDAAVSIDFAFARSLDGQENHVLELVYDRGLHAVRLRRRHAAERLQSQYHVAELVNGVINVLSDFQVPLAAA